MTLLFAQRRVLENCGDEVQLGHLNGGLILHVVVHDLVQFPLSGLLVQRVLHRLLLDRCLYGRSVFTFARAVEVVLPRSAAVQIDAVVVVIARLLLVHGHRVQLDRLRLLDLARVALRHHFVALADGVLVGRSRDGSDEGPLGLPLSWVVVRGVSPASEVVWIVHHLVLALIHLLIASTQLLDCVILLLLVHNLLGLLFRYFDLHVLKRILKICVLLVLLINN